MKKITENEVRSVYNNVALEYDRHRKKKNIYNDYLEKPATLSLLKNIRGKKVLDLGCGTGCLMKGIEKEGRHCNGVRCLTKND